MPTETRLLQLADGRRVMADMAGPHDGVPVFICHSLFGCRMIPPSAALAADERGVRLISPDRPGMGGSDYHPRRTVLDWADDAAELADLLGIERYRVMGISAGAPYALAACLKTPDRVERAAILTGVTPRDEAGVAHVIVPRFLNPALKRSRLVNRVVHRIIVTGVKRQPERAMQALSETLPACDKIVVERPEIKQFLIDGALEAARPGLRGWAYDDWLLNRPWGFAPRDIPATVPVDLWWGDEDSSVPVEHAKLLAEELPNATLHIKPGKGHFGVPFDHADEVFEMLVKPR